MKKFGWIVSICAVTALIGCSRENNPPAGNTSGEAYRTSTPAEPIAAPVTTPETTGTVEPSGTTPAAPSVFTDDGSARDSYTYRSSANTRSTGNAKAKAQRNRGSSQAKAKMHKVFPDSANGGSGMNGSSVGQSNSAGSPASSGSAVDDSDDGTWSADRRIHTSRDDDDMLYRRGTNPDPTPMVTDSSDAEELNIGSTSGNTSATSSGTLSSGAPALDLKDMNNIHTDANTMQSH